MCAQRPSFSPQEVAAEILWYSLVSCTPASTIEFWLLFEFDAAGFALFSEDLSKNHGFGSDVLSNWFFCHENHFTCAGHAGKASTNKLTRVHGRSRTQCTALTLRTAKPPKAGEQHVCAARTRHDGKSAFTFLWHFQMAVGLASSTKKNAYPRHPAKVSTWPAE